jgi:hypothetical protein
VSTKLTNVADASKKLSVNIAAIISQRAINSGLCATKFKMKANKKLSIFHNKY